MITISLCMIVKNEEAVLDRCLSSIADLMDEIIIVDTGSTDGTKAIAARYTSQIYDFRWEDDFAAARNFAFSKASMEYIYAPDADEVIDADNHRRFSLLKECLLPEIEIVQMEYITRTEHNTVENFKNELRPKLFKRLREFTWIDPVHETVRLDPVVYDSDIQILHLPQSSHGKRDCAIFEKNIYEKGGISQRIALMYAKELYKCGDKDDLARSVPFFEEVRKQDNLWVEAHIILAKHFRLTKDAIRFQQEILCNQTLFDYSEICCEIGLYFLMLQEYPLAEEWFKRAQENASPVIDIESIGPTPYLGLAECYAGLGQPEESDKYRKMAEEFELPEVE